MKLSEMDPDNNRLHAFFKAASSTFMKTELWKELNGIAMGFTFGEKPGGDFNFLKIVKNKVQIFRYFGDLLQADKSTDPQTYAAPEGHVEIEIRPERLDGIKIPRPRYNVYVPNMRPKEFEDTYTKRDATDTELQYLLTATFAAIELFKLMDESVHKASDWSVLDPKYQPFDITVSVPDVFGCEGTIPVRLIHPVVSPPGDRKCSFCSRTRTEMARCSGCKVAFYCCNDHQVLDWKSGHKAACMEARKSSSLTLDLSYPTIGNEVEKYSDLPWFLLTTDIDDFHNKNTTGVLDPEVYRMPTWSDDWPKPDFSKAAKLVASDPLKKVDGWKALYGALELPDNSPYASLLDQVMTVYSVLFNITGGHEKKMVTVHIPDACFEPTAMETFGLLLSLLPNIEKIRIVFCGRRLPKSLHYSVFSWKDSSAMQTIDTSSGKVGDVWRGQEDLPLAIRVFAADHSTMPEAEDCSAIILLNCSAHRHSFWFSTTHSCVQGIQKGVVVAASCYSMYATKQVAAAFAEVSKKEASQIPPPSDVSLNPFRNPMRSVSQFPVPCYQNAYNCTWSPNIE
eukprot:TRINITY_DN16822_c0_g1_i1.p1 TRINITY_DN16822_c0_g1~~TRINITY_DN16822_c0_g1_i1.p1  ORF type:complete len:566 (+),score=98.29 TRINITY_DN16822_c0_g1_i1:69-1766(+)